MNRIHIMAYRVIFDYLEVILYAILGNPVDYEIQLRKSRNDFETTAQAFLDTNVEG